MKTKINHIHLIKYEQNKTKTFKALFQVFFVNFFFYKTFQLM